TNSSQLKLLLSLQESVFLSLSKENIFLFLAPLKHIFPLFASLCISVQKQKQLRRLNHTLQFSWSIKTTFAQKNHFSTLQFF
ncbi:hypothetical protein NC651_007443, partial [Populus alba x Populus x berolinensis]